MSGNDDSQQLLEIDTPHFQTMHIPKIKDKKNRVPGDWFLFSFSEQGKVSLSNFKWILSWTA